MNTRRVYGLAGWLFADLMLLFLIVATSAELASDAATSPATTAPPATPAPGEGAPNATTTTATPPTTEAAPCGGLTLPIRTFQVRVPNAPDRDERVASEVRAHLERLGVAGRPAGLILAFGHGGGDIGAGVRLAEVANAAMRGRVTEIATLEPELQRSYFAGGDPVGAVDFQWFLAEEC